jgi:hypothetical protein
MGCRQERGEDVWRKTLGGKPWLGPGARPRFCLLAEANCRAMVQVETFEVIEHVASQPFPGKSFFSKCVEFTAAGASYRWRHALQAASLN